MVTVSERNRGCGFEYWEDC